MALDREKFFREPFNDLSQKNPLRKLRESDRILLVSLLGVYLHTPKSDQVTDFLEDVGDIAATAAALGKRLESKVFGGTLAQSFTPFLQNFSFLPSALAVFSGQLGGLVENVFGKPGQKAKMMKNQFLIMASELVRQKTGKHHDEHLAELLQSVANSNVDEDISGDAIRKKREHLKRVYPLIYQNEIRRVKRLLSR
jgi:hypothetical protein